MTAVTIRAAREDEVGRLIEIEIEAGQLFHEVGMSEVANHPIDPTSLRTALTADALWVGCLGSEIVGYVQSEVLDGNAHVAQVSVGPEFSRRGVGRRLVEHVERWGRNAGRPATTLTTFRDVPWNGPFYRRLGYAELAPREIGPELAAQIAREAAIPGIDPALRFAMIKPNLPSSL